MDSREPWKTIGKTYREYCISCLNRGVTALMVGMGMVPVIGVLTAALSLWFLFLMVIPILILSYGCGKIGVVHRHFMSSLFFVDPKNTTEDVDLK
jgi:hypothetical protein